MEKTDKVILEQLNKVDKKHTHANQTTLTKLDKIDRKLTNANLDTLAKLDNVDKKLTKADTDTVSKLQNVEKGIKHWLQLLLHEPSLVVCIIFFIIDTLFLF